MIFSGPRALMGVASVVNDNSINTNCGDNTRPYTHTHTHRERERERENKCVCMSDSVSESIPPQGGPSQTAAITQLKSGSPGLEETADTDWRKGEEGHRLTD